MYSKLVQGLTYQFITSQSKSTHNWLLCENGDGPSNYLLFCRVVRCWALLAEEAGGTLQEKGFFLLSSSVRLQPGASSEQPKHPALQCSAANRPQYSAEHVPSMVSPARHPSRVAFPSTPSCGLQRVPRCSTQKGDLSSKFGISATSPSIERRLHSLQQSPDPDTGRGQLILGHSISALG